LTERRQKWKALAPPPPDDSKSVQGQNRTKNFGVSSLDSVVGIVGSVINVDDSEVIVGGFGGSFNGERKRTPAAEITSEEFGRLKSEFAKSEGRQANEQYNVIIENDFLSPTAVPLSTFSIDVDTASYANVRRFLNGGQLPPPDAVRIEELLNYFRYDDPSPEGPQPFSVNLEVAACPWNAAHRLVRIGLKGKDFDRGQRPPTNLVFLVDVSGSMRDANKLPLVRRSLNMLVNEMGEDDRIAIVTYASNAGLLLDSTSGEHKDKIRKAINSLNAGGSTNGEAGIQLAYQTAQQHFYPQGSNRVILCTDGDFNVGVSSDEELVRMIQDKAAKSRVFLSIFGFGMGNLKDAKLEQLADKGNGHYGYIDGQREARKVFVEELTGTLFTIAKDVKIQIEFNPAQVGAYRLIGYENRVMAARDFDDDTKDAGEIGAGHTVTALYEIIPPDKLPQPRTAVALKYQQPQQKQPERKQPESEKKADESGELLTLFLRYKQPDGEQSTRLEYPLNDKQALSARASRDFDWTAAVAGFGMILRNSQYKGQADFDLVLELAAGSKGTDKLGRRQEFIDLVKKAKTLRGR
jgi:Ca-activated chloride channel family protein